MCGIVGVISNSVLTQAQKKIFKQLLEVDALRGHHSTGVLGVSNHNRTEIFKKAVASQEFFQYSEYDSITTGNNALIGHNRWATCGDLIHQNAHPFQHGDISGVHNGTLDNQYDLVDYLEYDVDSENIFVSMSKIGEQATIEKLEGAFTLVWHNKKNRTINFVRNEERPLHYCIVGQCIYFASEAKMLDWILDRNKITGYEIMSLPVGEWMSIKVGNIKHVTSKEVTLTKKTWYTGKSRGKSVTVTSSTKTGTRYEHMVPGEDVRFTPTTVAYGNTGYATVWGRVVNQKGQSHETAAVYGVSAESAGSMMGKTYLAKVSYINNTMNSVVLTDLAIVQEEQQQQKKFSAPLKCAMCGEYITSEDTLKEFDWGDGVVSQYHQECFEELESIINE